MRAQADKNSRLGIVNQGTWCQESWETSSNQARVRAQELRSEGYHVTVGSMGMQVTQHGAMKLTMIDISPGRNWDTSEIK